MANLGTLTLDLVARIGGYEAGLDKAEREAKKRAQAIERAFDNAFTTITAGFAILGSAGAAALVAVNAQAEAIAGYQDLADKVGDTAEAFASLQDASTISGVAMDTVAAASVRLTASLSKTDDESKLVGQAIKALGLEFDNFKKLSPVEQIDAVAKALAGFEDGAEKTAVAVALFGKAGAELLPFLNDLADGAERNVRLTADQIKAADDYSKSVARLKAEFDGFIKQQAAGMVPVLSQVVGLLGDLAKNEATVSVVTEVMNTAVKAAITVFQTLVVVASDVGFVFLGVGREIASWAAQLAALARLDLTGFRAISDAVKEDGKRARAELDAFQRRVMAIGQQPTTGPGFGTRAAEDRGWNPFPRPKLNVAGLSQDTSKSNKDDPTKKLLDNQLKDLERQIARERELMSDRNRMLDIYNSEGLVSIREYYRIQATILDEATTKQVAAYQEQINAIRDYQSKLPKKGAETDRAEAEGRINDLLEKQSKLLQQAGQAGLEAGFKQRNALREYEESVQDVNAQLEELKGNLAAAAQIRFDQSNRRTRQSFIAQGDENALKALDTLKQYTIAQANLNKLQQQFALGQGDLQIAEERIALARQAGTMTETQSLIALGDARQRQYASLQQQIAGFDKLKASMELSPEQMQQYDRLRLQLEQLGATLDPLADRINTMFDDSLGNLFSDLATGAKSAKDAFKDFFNSFAKEIIGLSSKDLAAQFRQALFPNGGGIGQWISESMKNSAGSNPFSSLGNWVTGLFGGQQTQGTQATHEGATADGSKGLGGIISGLFGGSGGAGLAASSTAATASITSMSAAAAAAAAALSSIAGTAATASLANAGSGGSGGGWASTLGSKIGDWFKGGGMGSNFGFASGGYTGSGSMFQPAGIVHRGEYVLDAATTKRLGVPALDRLSNGGGFGGGTTNISVTVQPGATRETGYQAARAMGAELQRARAR